jgi:hypothetical protein
LGERFNGIEEVVGSIPSGSTIQVKAQPAFRRSRRPAMRTRSRAALCGAIGAFGLLSSQSVSFAGSIDSRLVGAWTTSDADCKRLFVRNGGGFAFRQPVDKFAQAAIITPQEIRAPSSVCRVQKIARDSGALKVTAECNDSISYMTQSVQIRLKEGGEIIYSPTGDPALDTTLIKCGM